MPVPVHLHMVHGGPLGLQGLLSLHMHHMRMAVHINGSHLLDRAGVIDRSAPLD